MNREQIQRQTELFLNLDGAGDASPFDPKDPDPLALIPATSSVIIFGHAKIPATRPLEPALPSARELCS